MKVNEPQEYVERWLGVRKISTGVGPLAIERRTNRHPECNGASWGWYEMFPLGLTLGYWSDSGADDAKGFDIQAWNVRAKDACGEAAGLGKGA